MPSPEDMKAVEWGCSNTPIFLRRRKAHQKQTLVTQGWRGRQAAVSKTAEQSLEPVGSCLEALYYQKRFWCCVLSENIQVNPDHGQRVSFRACGISWPGLVACCAAGALLTLPGCLSHSARCQPCPQASPGSRFLPSCLLSGMQA